MSREAIIELGLVAFFVACALGETLLSHNRHTPADSGDRRLVTNFGLTAIVLVAGSLFPLARMTSAIASDRLNIGLTHIVHLPWLAIFAATLFLDSFAAYWAHRLMHSMPLLWRVHRVHHADRAVDVSTSLRNHPLELLVTVPPSMLVVLVIGASPSVILAVQTYFMAAAIWDHADLHLSARLDRALSSVIITPALHRVHHSRERQLHDSNFGDSLVLWDRLFGTLNRSDVGANVGLRGQRAPNDHLLQQLWSPLYSA